ncbi:MAG: D-glycero-beta-D-manno-heptose 1,7-bisphosphate 7-phosphatase [Arcobacter sp.]|nr:D-glycero-beta-D-manno-heptose 1,7-bisphosphate 7-phosphatase [Arcobacter sp.]
MKQKAIFLDRDGVINIEKDYLYKIEDFEFIDGVFEALRYLQSKGFLLFILTNQSGIGRGFYTQDDFLKLTKWMIEKFELEEIKISRVEFCPHLPDNDCECRKPKTGMIDNISNIYEIDFENSWLIGDKKSDIECAKNAMIKNTIQAKSGHSFETSIATQTIETLNLKSISKLIP